MPNDASPPSIDFTPDAPASGGIDFTPDSSSQSQAEPVAPQQDQSQSNIPRLEAAPERGLWDKIKTEARNAVSPIIGESRDQSLSRQASLAALQSISPTLANHVQESESEQEHNFKQGGAFKVLGGPIDAAIQTGGAVGGAELGGMTGVPILIPVGAAIGAAVGNYASQKRKIAEGEQSSINAGEVAGSAIAGGIPGGNLANTGIGSIASQGVKQGVGGLASYAVQHWIDDEPMDAKGAAWSSILPALTGSLAEHIQQISPEITAARTAAVNKVSQKSAILSKAQQEGFVVQPSSVNPSIANKAIESIGGGSSIRQQATHVNQEVSDNIARRILDPSNPDLELTSKVAQAVRQRAYDVGYRPIANAGDIATDQQFISDIKNIASNRQGAARSFPGASNNDVEELVKSVAVPTFDAGDGIKMIQVLRNASNDSFAQGRAELGIAQKQAAGALEGQIQRHLQAVSSGPTSAAQQQANTLLQNFRDARVLMAQSHQIEDAIREGGGSIIPSVIGTAFQNGKPLSGGLDTIGGFANNFPNVTREASKTAAPGINITGNTARVLGGATLAGAAGAATHSPEAAALAGAAGLLIPNVRGLARNLILSAPYQRIMTKIPIHVEHNPDLGALIIRQGGQAVAAKAAEEDQSKPVLEESP